MSIIKSLSVGNGDMFYIEHNSDNFTIIDCCMSAELQDEIVAELLNRSKNKGIVRFISTHPDDDHLLGLQYLNKMMPIHNFYCVNNAATKEDESVDFTEYCSLRDSDKAYHIYAGCQRKWMNQEDDERKTSGINILWPNTENEFFKYAQTDAAVGLSPNNISPIIKYHQEGNAVILWMGDLETEFMENIVDSVNLCEAAVLFAPHHGRDSGRVPSEFIEVINPKIIVIGEAPSQHLNYYAGYNTITQNSAGDIIFECADGYIDVYVSSSTYTVNYLSNRHLPNTHGYYIGSLDVS
jgi:beta-lactamase superfamily II metal-dependent hydrolase